MKKRARKRGQLRKKKKERGNIKGKRVKIYGTVRPVKNPHEKSIQWKWDNFIFDGRGGIGTDQLVIKLH